MKLSLQLDENASCAEASLSWLPSVRAGCGATLAVPAHAGHHGCIRAALSCALEQRATVAPTCHLASPAASRSRRSPPSLGTATAPVPAAAVAFRFLPTARPDPRRATPPTHKHMGTHLGIADPPAPCRRRRRPCRPRFHPLALLPTPSGRQQKHADRTLSENVAIVSQAGLASRVLGSSVCVCGGTLSPLSV